MTGVKLELIGELHQLEVLGIVPGLEVKLSNFVAGFVVEVERDGLHPGIVAVARVVDVPVDTINTSVYKN